MPATYVFKNASSIKYTGKGAKCGALHQAHIMTTLAGSAGLTRAALKAKLMAEEDKSWVGAAIASINDIVDTQLTKLVKNGALEAVKPGVAQLKERALAVGGDHAAAKALIKAEQKKAAAGRQGY
jgi:arginase family enzyme